MFSPIATPASLQSGTSSLVATNSPDSSSQSSAQNELNANSFITLLTTQLQAQDPLNPLDPNQMVNELTSMNTLQELIQIRQDMDTLVSAAQSGNEGPGGAGPGSGGSPGSGATAGNAASRAVASWSAEGDRAAATSLAKTLSQQLSFSALPSQTF
ncbi:MAG TPA: flagellar hook capping FlgD N-terminal domain-containing protein [Candidatus Acidoferrum sp.]|nr:flagellar hook capping FlgD N-terminal domain-containing protein [Candidatus Acidoferrum sp.]